MRFFIALDIPENSKQQLEKVQKDLKSIFPDLRLTDNDKLHLTIAFIGEQEETMKNPLTGIIKKAAENISSFNVSPSYLDGFPHLHTAHVLWVGVNGDIDKLYLLRHHIKDGLKSLNLDVDERRYVPHIAIGKINDFNLTPVTEKKIEEIMFQVFAPIKVTTVKLFESIPNHGFHPHNTLAEIKLKN